MLKTDLLDRFLTDSVKHKKPMECSEALFDTIDTLFLQVNPDGTLKYCNRVCREATGYSLEETEGRMFWEVFFPPEEREFIQNLFEEALEPPYRSSYEHQWRCRDGGSRLISFTISTYFEENTIQCYSVTGLDVTKLRWMEEELWRYRTDLEEQITQEVWNFWNRERGWRGSLIRLKMPSSQSIQNSRSHSSIMARKKPSGTSKMKLKGATSVCSFPTGFMKRIGNTSRTLVNQVRFRNG